MTRHTYNWDNHRNRLTPRPGGHVIWEGAAHRWFEQCLLHADPRPVGGQLTLIRTCDMSDCVAHTRWVKCLRPKYPLYVCVYCGMPAGTIDHVLPRNWTGEAQRKVTPVVPACGQCNCLIGDRYFTDIKERRAYCHEKLREKLKDDLLVVDGIEGLEGGLARQYTEALNRRQVAELRLTWPDDPMYDERAWAHIS